MNNEAPVPTVDAHATHVNFRSVIRLRTVDLGGNNINPGQDQKRKEFHTLRLLKGSHCVRAAQFTWDQKTHYFAIKLSSTTICRHIYSVISGDVAMNRTFKYYPFVTMWISSCLSTSSSPLILQNNYIIANHLLYLQRYFFLNKRLLFFFDCPTLL